MEATSQTADEATASDPLIGDASEQLRGLDEAVAVENLGPDLDLSVEGLKIAESAETRHLRDPLGAAALPRDSPAVQSVSESPGDRASLSGLPDLATLYPELFDASVSDNTAVLKDNEHVTQASPVSSEHPISAEDSPCSANGCLPLADALPPSHTRIAHAQHKFRGGGNHLVQH